MQNAKYQILVKRNGRHHLRLVTAKGGIIFSAGSFANKSGCQAHLRVVKQATKRDCMFERSEVAGTKFKFVLKDCDGMVVAVSPHFDSASDLERAIDLAHKFGFDAPVEEASEGD